MPRCGDWLQINNGTGRRIWNCRYGIDVDQHDSLLDTRANEVALVVGESSWTCSVVPCRRPELLWIQRAQDRARRLGSTCHCNLRLYSDDNVEQRPKNRSGSPCAWLASDGPVPG